VEKKLLMADKAAQQADRSMTAGTRFNQLLLAVQIDILVRALFSVF
jgi:hypothetical protein